MSELGTPAAVRVLVIADDALTRLGLEALVARQPGLSVVASLSAAELGQGADAVASSTLYRPDLLLWDAGWQGEEARLEQIAAVSDELPPILAIAPEGLSAQALWTAGVRGLLSRHATETQIGAALHALAQGLRVFQQEGAPRRSRQIIPNQLSAPEPLTPRELEVLQAIADGMANKQIARALGMSEHTVKFHVNAILGKLDAASRTEAVVRATRAGILLL